MPLPADNTLESLALVPMQSEICKRHYHYPNCYNNHSYNTVGL
jgi:hypothetical protein